MLIPCVACRRHIETTEPACPFCGAANDARPIARTRFDGRLSRAAVFAGATAMAAPACIVSNPPPPQYQYQQQPPPPPPPPPDDRSAAGDPNPDYAQPPPDDQPPPPDDTYQPPPPDDTPPPPPPPPAPTAMLRGRIIDQRGRPVGSIQIDLLGGRQPVSVITDANGTYKISVEPGSYRMAVVGAGTPRTVKLVAGKESIVNLSISTKLPPDEVRERHHSPKPYGAPPARRRTV